MGNSDLVVKSNRLNSAIQNLSLPELRIIQLAIVDARETGKGLNTDTPLRIDGLRYAEAFNTTRQNAYIMLKQAEETLFNRRFSFIDGDGKLVKSRWIQRVRYLDDEGAIELAFYNGCCKSNYTARWSRRVLYPVFAHTDSPFKQCLLC